MIIVIFKLLKKMLRKNFLNSSHLPVNSSSSVEFSVNQSHLGKENINLNKLAKTKESQKGIKLIEHPCSNYRSQHNSSNSQAQHNTLIFQHQRGSTASSSRTRQDSKEKVVHKLTTMPNKRMSSSYEGDREK